MSAETVRAFLAECAPDIAIIELGMTSSTMALSQAWNIAPAQVAKALSLKVGERTVMLVTCGNSRLDNRKVKAALGGKPRMLPPEEASVLTGHPVGGVCPFALATEMPIYFDVKLKAYEEVVPAAGSVNTAMRIHPLRMADLVGAKWVDVCEG